MSDKIMNIAEGRRKKEEGRRKKENNVISRVSAIFTGSLREIENLSTVNCQLSTVNCQLSSEISPIANCDRQYKATETLKK
ncbi:MAG: hypothetical protein HC942_00310 [Microcoleus sp. SU_5_6]|nr:hypothetical protein [Microcoleus sp. SU_5_6]